MCLASPSILSQKEGDVMWQPLAVSDCRYALYEQIAADSSKQATSRSDWLLCGYQLSHTYLIAAK